MVKQKLDLMYLMSTDKSVYRMAVISSVSGSALDILNLVGIGPGEVTPAIDTWRILLWSKGRCDGGGSGSQEKNIFGEHTEKHWSYLSKEDVVRMSRTSTGGRYCIKFDVLNVQIYILLEEAQARVEISNRMDPG